MQKGCFTRCCYSCRTACCSTFLKAAFRHGILSAASHRRGIVSFRFLEVTVRRKRLALNCRLLLVSSAEAAELLPTWSVVVDRGQRRNTSACQAGPKIMRSSGRLYCHQLSLWQTVGLPWLGTISAVRDT